MPVPMPASAASASQLCRRWSSDCAQSLWRPALTPLAPTWVFTPVALAVMVPAECGVCASVVQVLLSAVAAEVSQGRWCSDRKGVVEGKGVFDGEYLGG